MLIKKINIKDTPFSSGLVRDYIESEKLNSFFSYKNQLDNYKKIIKKKIIFSLKKKRFIVQRIKISVQWYLRYWFST